MYLEKINSPSDIKKLSVDEMKKLTQEMRDALIFKLSRHGGHCGPNLGFAEATVALHYVFDSPVDKIVFDVSHQTYCHKMLTGRKDGFLYEEHFDDISGYSNPAESEHDFFVIGHTSTSVSLALGLAKARDLKHESGNVIAVIGDGSLSGGEALEAIDYAGEFDGNLIIIINDNDMSIAENHGGMYKNLKALRDGNGKADTNLFTAMGLDYVFVKDGNDIESLIAAFSKVKDSKRPVAVHIVTEKGKGLSFAEENKEDWHWHMPFDVETGKAKYNYDGEDYGDLTAKMLLEKMKKDESVCVLTSGTPTVGGFWKGRRDEAGRQFIKAMSRYEGIRVVLIAPDELRLPEYMLHEIETQTEGVEFREVSTMEEVMPELDILYMTRVQKERFLDEEEFNRVKDSFVLDPSKLRTAKSDMIVLHPLPRVNEITRAVDNDPRAAYFRQVENGKFVRMALIYTLLKWAEGEKLAAVPDLAEGMFIDRSMKCPNSRCISATEDVDPLFVKAGDTCRCAYCEAKIR